ncbi:MAG: ribosomal protein [Patescibacteria group bacterium]|nr:ribosomal protein [Patescibacteria group bacterium]
MEAKVYNKSGKEAGKVSLDDKLFGLTWNADLVHQVITSMQNNARVNIAHTKNRADVSGGGKKPWRQKGTGRARHGSTRSPIWVGGGVAHGPRNEREFERKINKKMKTKALFTILSQKLRDGELVFIDSLSFSSPKAGEAQKIINSLATVKGLEKIAYKTGKRAYVALPEKDDNALLSFRNFKSVKLEEARNTSPLDLMTYKYVVVVAPEEAVKTLTARVK